MRFHLERDNQDHIRDVEMLAGHAALSTTQRYIEAEVEAQRGRGADLADEAVHSAFELIGGRLQDVKCAGPGGPQLPLTWPWAPHS